MNLEKLCESAMKAALAAGAVIRSYQNEDIEVEHKEGGSNYASQVVSKVDREAEQAVLKELIPSCEKYDLGLLSEETEDDGGRLEKDFFWCIDPLDGTLCFLNNFPGYSVSIALVSKSGEPLIGVVYDPSRDNLYHALKGQGAFKNRSPWQVKASNDYFTYVTDHYRAKTPRRDDIKLFLKQKLESLKLDRYELMEGAGCVLNGILVLENGPACMLKHPKAEKGGGSIWDYAATACIFKEMGKVVGGFNGEPLDLNKAENTFMNHQGMYYENV
jgi:fructose-1,6-bisphosphatase/inositol monophosphatase family enzyme